MKNKLFIAACCWHCSTYSYSNWRYCQNCGYCSYWILSFFSRWVFVLCYNRQWRTFDYLDGHGYRHPPLLMHLWSWVGVKIIYIEVADLSPGSWDSMLESHSWIDGHCLYSCQWSYSHLKYLDSFTCALEFLAAWSPSCFAFGAQVAFGLGCLILYPSLAFVAHCFSESG